MNEREIFSEALAIVEVEAREAYLLRVCGGDHRLKKRIGALLQSADQAGNFLESPPPAVGGVVPQIDPTMTMRRAGGTARDAIDDSGLDTFADGKGIEPQIGPYRLLEKIGQGGMGTVYMAQQKHPVKRMVALKVITPGMDSKEVIARFEAERQALAMMDHTNIARIFDGGLTEQGRPYFVMELVRGLPIDRYCDQARLRLPDRLRLFIDVCRAVQHAHQKGIIHRDLKPSNILITLYDDLPVVKVIDFGIAKALDHDLTDRTLFTRFTGLMGSPVYMSPEQAEMNGLDVDTRSDVYALGVLLYELLTGATPFAREAFKEKSLDEMLRIIREDEPPRPSRRIDTMDDAQGSTISERRGVDRRVLTLSMRRELDWIVMRALEKNRDRRYPSTADLAADVQRHLDNVPVVACPPTLMYRCQKAFHRNRATIITMAVIFLVLFATSTISLWQAFETRRAWHASELREAQSQDLLEAMQLQVAISAFRQAHLIRLSDASSAVMKTQRQRTAASADSGSLANLLHATAEPQPQIAFQHPASILDIGVASDSDRLVMVDATGRVKKCDVTTSSPGEELGAHNAPAHAVAISPDGKRAVSGSAKGDLWFWDLERAVVTKKINPVETGIETIVWSPDGRYIAVGARYNQVWVCDAEGVEQFRIVKENRYESLLFSTDSQRLFVPTAGNIDVWNVASRKRKTSFAIDPLKNARAMCWAGPDKRWLVVGERFLETLLILDGKTGARLGRVAAGIKYAQHLAASNDGQWLVATYASGHALLFRLAESTDGSVNGTLQLHFRFDQLAHSKTSEPRWTVRWFDDSRRFVTAGGDGKVQVWGVEQIQPSRLLRLPRPGGDENRIKYAFPLGERKLAYIFHDHEMVRDRLHYMDLYGNAVVKAGRKTPCRALRVSMPSDQGLVAVAGEGKVAVVSLDTGHSIGQFPTSIADPHQVAISMDASVVAVSSEADVKVWRTRDQWSTTEMVGSWPARRERAPLLADSGRTLIFKHLTKPEITEVDLESGEPRRKYEVSSTLAKPCVSHDGEFIAVASVDRIRVWNRRSSDLVLDASNLSNGVCLAFFPDDRVLVSGHEDRKIRAWHLPTGQSLGILFAPPPIVAGNPVQLFPAPSGRNLVVWYEDAPQVIQVVVLGRIPPEQRPK
jgi:serine/threonine protein kinase/WD40 repeat protein